MNPEQANQNTAQSTSRRTVLKGLGTASAFAVVGVSPVQAGKGKGGGRPEYTGNQGDLVAAQDNDVGEVTVELDGSDILVKYEMDSPWCLWRTHVDVDYSPDDNTDDFPLTPSGNPKIGNFDYSANHLCEDSFTYTIPTSEEGDVESEDTILVAAHAEVVDSSDITCSTETPEEIYLTDSSGPGDTSGTEFYSLNLNDTEGRAELTPLATLPPATDSGPITTGFSQVDALAATPDGKEVYFYDKFSAKLGVWDVGAEEFTEFGPVSNDPGSVVLAAFSPFGELYIASGETDTVYTVNLNNLTVSPLANETGIDLDGADLVFTSEGTLYLWTKSGESDPPEADEGLYTVDLDQQSPTQGEATAVDQDETGNITVAKFTGLAVRDAGTGLLVASDKQSENDRIVEVDQSTGVADFDNTLPMYTPDGSGGWERFTGYDNGDMTTGSLCEPASETAWAFDDDNEFPGNSWGWYLEEDL